MRATVGHLTRNIKISGTPEDNWGGHIYIYNWIVEKEQDPINARGSITFDGVELNNMGQRDCEKAGI